MNVNSALLVPRDRIERPTGELYLAGTGSLAIEVAEWAEDAGWTVAGLIELLDSSRVGAVLGGRPVVAADRAPEGAWAVVAAGGSRREHWTRLRENGWRSGAIVHPNAHVSRSARIAAGSIVAPGAVVGAETLMDEHTLASRGVLLGHHVRIGAFTSLLPGANVGGHAEVREDAMIGMGSMIVNGVRVGAGATVAAGALVLREVAARTRVQGVPAREFPA